MNYFVSLQSNMKYKYLLIGMVAMLTTTAVQAQQWSRRGVSAATEQIVKSYTDSLAALRHQLDSIQRVNDSLRTESSDGRYFRLFAPTTFYHSGANQMLSLAPRTGDDVTDAVDAAMMSLYLRRPDLVQNTESPPQGGFAA